MTDLTMHPDAVVCAQRFDGHLYKRLHPDFRFDVALDQFRSQGHWQHLSRTEAMATMSLLYQALESWKRYDYDPHALAGHLKAFHSLYELLKDEARLDDQL